ncbi:signal peptide, CUB and EGF-like domain-containing protein 2 isoform X3 [Eurytemora carolleeae]|uniref:signal peptide, CUB and EGF-like domain-containing protein 2 isoform X3 n=1 Tax=Eurytemora carolleeae TaxID=1294199 RepID=UPI000C75CF1B|nr:signal peptide, CUB and EGF-like domain-containing protein 2 isoform X3 [Eurytemora carolleeae]|eukprot:XP_023324984.1 signal peptide, CUB and EGF-like domain-containing protein 2 isoform X3 [Eurytemora affinis]
MVTNLFYFLVFVCVAYGYKFSSFKRINNMTLSHWASNQISIAQSNIHCASHCLLLGDQGTPCNSFKFSEDGSCETGNISRIIDVPAGNISLEIFVADRVLSTLPRLCMGGEGCCQGECELGDGDCNQDQDCKAPFICGSNNCWTEFKKGNGSWDEEDDCCTKKCGPGRLCGHGEGVCLTMFDCKLPGYHLCSLSSCQNSTIFSELERLEHTSLSLIGQRQCCHRACGNNYKCGNNTIGCASNLDCLPGHECIIKEDGFHFCRDINECTDPRHSSISLSYCGANTFCNDTLGNYTCSCKPGYNGWIPYSGCSDIDECLGYDPCLYSYTECTNTVGNYTCSCKTGFVPNVGEHRLLQCTDLDECVTYPGICGENTICSDTTGSYRCSCKSGYSGLIPGVGCDCPTGVDPELNGCGEYLNGTSGYFTSPNYPNNFPSYVECYWVIQVEEGYHVLFNFTDIVTGSSSSYVRIRYGKCSTTTDYLVSSLYKYSYSSPTSAVLEARDGFL